MRPAVGNATIDATSWTWRAIRDVVVDEAVGSCWGEGRLRQTTQQDVLWEKMSAGGRKRLHPDVRRKQVRGRPMPMATRRVVSGYGGISPSRRGLLAPPLINPCKRPCRTLSRTRLHGWPWRVSPSRTKPCDVTTTNGCANNHADAGMSPVTRHDCACCGSRQEDSSCTLE